MPPGVTEDGGDGGLPGLGQEPGVRHHHEALRPGLQVKPGNGERVKGRVQKKKTANYPHFVDKRLTPPPLIHVGRS